MQKYKWRPLRVTRGCLTFNKAPSAIPTFCHMPSNGRRDATCLITAEYLQTGQVSISSIYTQLDRHHDRAIDAFKTSSSQTIQHIADLLWIGCRETVQNSIWTHIFLPSNCQGDGAYLAKSIAKDHKVCLDSSPSIHIYAGSGKHRRFIRGQV